MSTQVRIGFKSAELQSLDLKPGSVCRFLAPSGAGKTALGLFLAEESARSFLLPRTSPAFHPQPDWKFELDGNIRPVEYLDARVREHSLGRIFNLEERFADLSEEVGVLSCSDCGGVVRRWTAEDWKAALLEIKPNYLCVAVRFRVRREESVWTLSVLRAERVVRLLVNGKLERLPEREDEAQFLSRMFHAGVDEVQLDAVFAALDPASLDFDERFLSALKVARTAHQVIGGIEAVEIVALTLVEDRFSEISRIEASSDLVCVGCGRSGDVNTERLLVGKTSAELFSDPISELVLAIQSSLSQEIHWLLSALCEMGLGNLSLSTSPSVLPAFLRRELYLLRLDYLGTSDSIVYVDGAINESRLAPLLERGNVVVLTSLAIGSDILRQTPITSCNVPTLSPTDRLESRKFLFQFIDLHHGLAELFASLPEARMSGIPLSAFKAPFCEHCRGRGNLLRREEGLGSEQELCGECLGERVRPELLAVRYQDRNLADVLSLTIFEAIRLFSRRPELHAVLEPYRFEFLSELKLGDEIRLLPGQKYVALRLVRELLHAESQIVIDYLPQEVDPAFCEVINTLNGRATGPCVIFTC